MPPLNNRRRYIVKIRFHRSVDSFSMLSEFSSTLRYIDNHASEPFYDLRKAESRSKIISFYVGSPPEITVLANPAWIALFVAILANYHNIKNNIDLISSDIEKTFREIKGIGERTRIALLENTMFVLQNLSHEARSYLEIAGKELAEAENKLRIAEDRMHRYTRSLRGYSEEEPTIEIIDFDDDDKWSA